MGTDPDSPFAKLSSVVNSFPFSAFPGSVPDPIIHKNEDVSNFRVSHMVEQILSAIFSALRCDQVEWWTGVSGGSSKVLLQLGSQRNEMLEEALTKKLLREVSDEPVHLLEDALKDLTSEVHEAVAIPVRWANTRSGECVLLIWKEDRNISTKIDENLYSYFVSTLDDFFGSVRGYEKASKSQYSPAHTATPERKGRSPQLSSSKKTVKTRQRSRSGSMGEAAPPDHQNPEADLIKQDVRESAVIADTEPRRGKWSDEEEQYASYLVQCFRFGTLPLHEGATLRTTLAEQLHCTPMRITKKYNKDASIGKQVYKRDFSKTAAEWRVERDEALRELRRLRYVFVESIKKRNQIDLDSIVDNAIGSYKYCTLIPYGETEPAVDEPFERSMRKEVIIPSPNGITPSWEASAPTSTPADLSLPGPQRTTSTPKSRALSAASQPQGSHSRDKRTTTGNKRERSKNAPTNLFNKSQDSALKMDSGMDSRRSTEQSLSSQAPSSTFLTRETATESSANLPPAHRIGSGMPVLSVPTVKSDKLDSDTPSSSEDSSKLQETIPLSHGGTSNYFRNLGTRGNKGFGMSLHMTGNKRPRSGGSELARSRSTSLDSGVPSHLSTVHAFPKSTEPENKKLSLPQQQFQYSGGGQQGAGFLRPEYRPAQSEQLSQTKDSTAAQPSTTLRPLSVPKCSSNDHDTVGIGPSPGPSPLVSSESLFREGGTPGFTPGFTPRITNLDASSQLVLQNIGSGSGWNANSASTSRWMSEYSDEYEFGGESSPNSPLEFLASEKPPRRRALSAGDMDIVRSGSSPMPWRDSNGEDSDSGDRS